MSIGSKIIKKNNLIILSILIIILGVASTVILIKRDDPAQSVNQVPDENNSDSPEAIDEPKPDNLAEPPQESTLDTELPKGTVSPQTVASDANKYFNKQLKVRGLIVEVSSGSYSIISQKAEEDLGLRLDFAGSGIDPQQYSNSGYESSEKHFNDPVTVIGKLKTPDGKNPLTFKVTSVQ